MTVEQTIAEAMAELPEDPAEIYGAQVRTVAQALLPHDPVPALVKGIFRQGGLYVVYSSPGQLKSNLLLDLCFSVGTGQPWLQGLPGKANFAGYDVTCTPSVWVDQDNGADVMRERMAAFARAYEAPNAPLYCLSFPVPAVAMARGGALLTAYARSVGAGLIVLDNLLRVAGVRDENASEIDIAMGNLRQLAEDTGATVIVIHHRRKETLGREGDSMRGHSSIEAALDAAFLVTRREDSDEITVKCTKARRKPIDPFTAVFGYDLADDNETLHSARLWRVELQDKRMIADAALRRQIVASLAGGPLKTNDIAAAVTGARAAVLTVLNLLREEGAVKCEAGQHGAKIYSLPPVGV